MEEIEMPPGYPLHKLAGECRIVLINDQEIAIYKIAPTGDNIGLHLTPEFQGKINDASVQGLFDHFIVAYKIRIGFFPCYVVLCTKTQKRVEISPPQSLFNFYCIGAVSTRLFDFKTQFLDPERRRFACVFPTSRRRTYH
jgi:hypothetical protein